MSGEFFFTNLTFSFRLWQSLQPRPPSFSARNQSCHKSFWVKKKSEKTCDRIFMRINGFSEHNKHKCREGKSKFKVTLMPVDLHEHSWTGEDNKSIFISLRRQNAKMNIDRFYFTFEGDFFFFGCKFCLSFRSVGGRRQQIPYVSPHF